MMRWMIPTCRKMGRMNRHHSVYIHLSFLSGGRERGKLKGEGKREGRTVRGFTVETAMSTDLFNRTARCWRAIRRDVMMNLTKKRKKMTSYTYLEVSFKQASSKVAGKAETFFIQGGKRAPILMRTSEDGPIWALMVCQLIMNRVNSSEKDVPCS